ncbi:DEHA2G20570p [Debaryomyces hansenii CBS767]|uniref:DEHA2G20570p n=1 Tax=Debaryomyces hansenii (strain ATCC 36239 / CBS 767 / BCRC 21394 / JCM 1990 / NBRC 0083 / IGC 2968) TaxID=284592 RepID=B5RUW6_DEBHA|nr:DEHA2G20570p [Debaryomyces hansenii CBS767]CAR66010.1 DEHA2G20570p [Debaryomyces hansenii CBS767]|eukprot:XP_002770678.1 DEHA2G20570p [Debaryomyces hansenii CBS767]
MSKVNRRQEIKKKEELQARFQVAISQTNSKILNWLQPNNEIVHDDKEKNSFFNLPIIPQGSGLSNIDKSNRNIGDFINSDETKFKQLQDGNHSNDNLRKTNSKPMMALMNKMRNTNRDKVKKRGSNQNMHTSKSKVKIQDTNIDNSDSDEEMMAKNRSVKKGSNLLFESKIKKKRPF